MRLRIPNTSKQRRIAHEIIERYSPNLTTWSSVDDPETTQLILKIPEYIQPDHIKDLVYESIGKSPRDQMSRDSDVMSCDQIFTFVR